MRLAGATRGSISDTVQYGTSGLRVGTLREGDAEIPMYLRLPEVERDGLDRLRDLSVWSPGANGYVPMANLVSGFEPRLVEALIHRRDRERTITVLGGAGGDLTADEAFRSVRSDIEAIRLPEGYTMKWGWRVRKRGRSAGKSRQTASLGLSGNADNFDPDVQQSAPATDPVDRGSDVGHGDGSRSAVHWATVHVHGASRLL
jgi:multidrug efflux pump subunit AcrB